MVCTLALACLVAGSAFGAGAPPVSTLHVTDLFRPHNDPDDHWDLATQYALAMQGKVDLRGVMIDHPNAGWAKAPDICVVAQLNHITGKAVPVVVGSPRVPAAEEMRTGAAAADLAGVRAFLELMRQSPRPVVVHVVGSCRDVALAARLEPELVARRCAGIYLNAGSERVQNYFMAMYAGGKTADGLWLQQLAAPKDAEALAAQGSRDRNMWCTAGFLHAAGLTVTKSGEIVPLKSASDVVFAFEPVRVKCSAAGVTEWTKDPQSKKRFILRVTDVERYQSAMTSALKSLLTKLP